MQTGTARPILGPSEPKSDFFTESYRADARAEERRLGRRVPFYENERLEGRKNGGLEGAGSAGSSTLAAATPLGLRHRLVQPVVPGVRARGGAEREVQQPDAARDRSMISVTPAAPSSR